MICWLEALRIRHWIKSGFCLVALLFSGAVFEMEAWLQVLPLLLGFSMISSAGYLFNDLWNVSEDRRHYRKRFRPIAAGRVKAKHAWVVLSLLVPLTFGLLMWTYGWTPTTWVVAGYFVLSFSYTLVFRELPFLDVLVVGVCFVARVAAQQVTVPVGRREEIQ